LLSIRLFSAPHLSSPWTPTSTRFPYTTLFRSGWLALLYVMVLATAVGQQAWLYGVRGVGPSRAGIFGNLIPVSALFFSLVILGRSEEHTSELQSRENLVCRLLLEKKKIVHLHF